MNICWMILYWFFLITPHPVHNHHVCQASVGVVNWRVLIFKTGSINTVGEDSTMIGKYGRFFLKTGHVLNVWFRRVCWCVEQGQRLEAGAFLGNNWKIFENWNLCWATEWYIWLWNQERGQVNCAVNDFFFCVEERYGGHSYLQTRGVLRTPS